MNNKKIIIDVPFNIDFTNYFLRDSVYGPNTQDIFDRHFHLTQEKDWIEYRIKIFMDYTGKSFINQINQSFVALIRYNEPTKNYIFEALSNYPRLPDNIKFVTNEEATEIIEKAMSENEYLYHVNIDSDNMYDRAFINQVDNYPYKDSIECLLCHEGYIYDALTNRLAMINHYSPSLFIYVYNKETYKQYFKDRLFESHLNAEFHKNEHLIGRTYMLIIHEKNLDNKFDGIVSWLGAGLTTEGEEKIKILKEWNII